MGGEFITRKMITVQWVQRADIYLLFSWCEKYRAGIPLSVRWLLRNVRVQGTHHGASVAQDCVSLKDSHIDFLFKHAKWSMKSRLRNRRRKGSKAETHWPENFKHANRWLSFPISSRGPLADSSSSRLLTPMTIGITLFILFHSYRTLNLKN